MHQWRLRSPRQVYISLWKVVGALVSLKGIHLHSQKPNSTTVNAVSGLLSSSIMTCQYLNFRLSEEKHWEPCKLSSVSSMQGSEYASLMAWLAQSVEDGTLNPRVMGLSRNKICFAGVTSPLLGEGLCSGPMVGVDKNSDTGSLVGKNDIYSAFSGQTIFIKMKGWGDKVIIWIKRKERIKKTLQWTRASLKQ